MREQKVELDFGNHDRRKVLEEHRFITLVDFVKVDIDL